MSAYDECYLMDAKRNLADCFDYAINDCLYNPDTFVFMFLNSKYSKLFETGNPGVISGKSGVELAMMIIGESTDTSAFLERRYSANKSKEYWALYSLAEYQWFTGRSFEDIFYRISLKEIINMYNPYHEMDISKFIKDFDKKMKDINIESKLKHIRQAQGLSQSQLAKLSGINIRNIQMYEQKQNNIDKAQGDILFALAHALNCNIEDILENVTYNYKDRSRLFGCAKGLVDVPDNFDDIDITSDFKEDLV